MSSTDCKFRPLKTCEDKRLNRTPLQRKVKYRNGSELLFFFFHQITCQWPCHCYLYTRNMQTFRESIMSVTRTINHSLGLTLWSYNYWCSKTHWVEDGFICDLKRGNSDEPKLKSYWKVEFSKTCVYTNNTVGSLAPVHFQIGRVRLWSLRQEGVMRQNWPHGGGGRWHLK